MPRPTQALVGAGVAQPADERAGGGVDVAAGAGDAHRRDGVDEAAAGLDGLRRRASVDDGRREEDAVEAGALARRRASRRASSGMRSGVMSPAPPAATRSSAKRSTPYCTTGFQ